MLRNMMLDTATREPAPPLVSADGLAHDAGAPGGGVSILSPAADLLAPFAISWVEPDTRDSVRVTYRDESGRHTAMVDVAGDDPEIYGITVGLHGIESSYALDLTGDRWHEVLAAAEVVRGGGRWVETPSLDAINAELVVANAEVML